MNRIRTVSRQIYPLILARLILSLGNFVYPFLTLYLMRKQHLPEIQIGAFLSMTMFAAMAGGIFSGVLSDRVGRRKVILGAALIAAGAYICVPFVSAPFWLYSCLITGLTAIAAMDPPFNALIADMTAKHMRKTVYSLLYLVTNVGFALGPFLASLMFEHHSALLFIGDGISTLIAGLIIFALCRDHIVFTHHTTIQQTTKTDALLPRIKRKSQLLFFMVIFVVWPFLISQLFFTLPLFLNTQFGAKGVYYYGILTTTNGIAIIVFSLLLTRFFRKNRALLNVIIGGILLSIGFGSYMVLKNPIGIIVMVLVWSAGEILSTTNAHIYIAEKSTIHTRGKLNSLLNIAIETGYGISPFLTGICIAHWHSIRLIWLFVGIIGLAGAGAMTVLYILDIRTLMIRRSRWRSH